MGQPVLAVRLFGASEALYRLAGYSIEPSDLPIYERHLAVAGASLDEADYRVP